jgi:hypothetical protein
VNRVWLFTLITLLLTLHPAASFAQDCSFFTRRLFFIKPKPQEEIWAAEKDYGFNDPRVVKMKIDLEHVMKTGQLDLIKKFNKGVSGAYLIEVGPYRAVLKPSKKELGMIAGNEVAAYRLDQHLGGVNHVPMTIRRNIAGEDFSMQIYIANAPDLSSKHPKNIANTPLAFFDYLIDNTDRRAPNVLAYEDQLIAIDHGLSFRSGHVEKAGIPKNKSWSLRFYQECKKMILYRRMTDECVLELLGKSKPDEAQYQILKNTTEDKFRNLLKNQISDFEIESFLKRRQIILNYMDKKPLGIDHT